MRLIELSANHSSFHRVTFNRTGLSLIVGRYTSQTAKNVRSTYNGVGKSLIVALIHYCLGSNKNAELDANLEGWQFTLTFEHNGEIFEFSRATNDSKMHVNGKQLPVSKARNILAEVGVFDLPGEAVKNLTPRSLLCFFVRPHRSSYISYSRPQRKWTDYQSVLCQSFLLGLDYQRAVKKHDDKLRLDEQAAIAQRYRQDQELREFYVGDKNPEVELASLNARIDDLERNIRQFEVAADYSERQITSDELHRQLLELSNEQVVLQNLVRDIDLALEVRPDVPPEDVVQLYAEAQVHLPALVTQRLADVQEFYDRLRTNRSARLVRERDQLLTQIAAIESRRQSIQGSLDSELQYLNAHRALDEYTENNRYLAELTAKQRKVQDYIALLSRYTEESQRIKIEMGQASLDTGHYLRSQQPILDQLMMLFRTFAQELYGPVPSGLVVRNNDGENQLRYDIEAHISYDQADGINQGKIFCYDLLLLALRANHHVEFLFHDNRLFADMSRNQRYSLFKLADRVCRDSGCQYIATLNEDVIDSVSTVAGEDFNRLFVEPQVLELTDAPGGAGKLLGIQVDMQYDNED